MLLDLRLEMLPTLNDMLYTAKYTGLIIHLRIFKLILYYKGVPNLLLF